MITRLSPLLLAGALSAQTVAFFPFDHASREGSSSITNRPLSAGVSRVQIAYSRFRLGMPNGAVIQRIGFRPDVAGTGAGRQVVVEILMGHAAPTTLNTGMSTTFASNYSTTPVTVYTPKTLTLPTIPAASAGPNNNYVWIPLDVPFTYDNTQNLVVEYRVTANNNGNAAFSYSLDAGGAVTPTGTFGVACQTSGASTPALTCGAATVGANWNHSLTNGPASSAGILLIGTSNTTFNGIPLPFSLASLGANGCSLAVSPDLSFTVATTTSRSFSVNIALPNVPPMAGQTFYCQAVLADVFANSLGLITSNGSTATLGVAPQASVVVATGSATAATGTRTNNFGLVSLFEY